MDTHKCATCGEVQPKTAFNRRAERKSGIKSTCKQCLAKWRREHPEVEINRRVNEPDKYCARLAKRKAQHRANYPNVREVKLRQADAWGKANPERKRLIAAKASAKRRKAIGISVVTVAEWRDVLEYFNHQCAYCLSPHVKLQMDHVVPVARGGPHHISNLVPACPSCNIKKHANSLLVFLMRQEAA